MPELPEVETVKRTLEKKVKGLFIDDATISMPKIIKDPSVEDFITIIRGKKITSIERRGKYLIIRLSTEYALVVHLRMTGQLVYSEADKVMDKHTHVVFKLSDGHQLRFIDQRQFGKLYLLPYDALNTISGINTMGLEPLGEEFTKEYLKKMFKNKRTKIKTLLLDQTFIAGIGNIYADEALHRAKVHPERTPSSLNSREISRLHIAIKEVLLEGIANRGTSIKDYVDGEGNKGGFQKLLKVYGREKESCYNCKTPIERKKIGGRSSHFCPHCQKF